MGRPEACPTYKVSVTVVDHANMLKAILRDDGSNNVTVEAGPMKTNFVMAYWGVGAAGQCRAGPDAAGGGESASFAFAVERALTHSEGRGGSHFV